MSDKLVKDVGSAVREAFAKNQESSGAQGVFAVLVIAAQVCDIIGQSKVTSFMSALKATGASKLEVLLALDALWPEEKS